MPTILSYAIAVFISILAVFKTPAIFFKKKKNLEVSQLYLERKRKKVGIILNREIDIQNYIYITVLVNEK